MANDKSGKKKAGGKSGFNPFALIKGMGKVTGSKSVVGLQITKDMLRIVEIDKSQHPPRVMNFSAIDPLMNNVNEATDQIMGLLNEKDIAARIAYGLVFEAGVEHRRVSLPVLKKKEMEALVRREVKKIVPDASPKDISSDFHIDKAQRKGGAGKKADVLIGVVPRENPERTIKLMESCGIETQLVSTVPMCLIANLPTLGPITDDKVVAMVHLERERSYLVIANRGSWVFSREFPTILIKEEDEDASDGSIPLDVKRRFRSAKYFADEERLLVEVNRSLLYFKQRFRGEGVSLAVLSGEAFNSDKVVEAFNTNLGINTIEYKPAEFFNYEHLGDRAGKLDRIFPSLALPMGAAMQSPRSAQLNFVPKSYLSRRKAKAYNRVMTAASIIFLVVMLGVYFVVRGNRVEAQKLYAEKVKEDLVTEMSRNLDKIAEMTAKRELADTRRKFIDSEEMKQGREKDLLLALGYLINPDIMLYSVSFANAQGDSVSIVGTARGHEVSAPDKSFSEFYGRLKQSGLFDRINEPLLFTKAEDGGYALNFAINCSLVN